jgi:pseudaminic acid biosynthesis-associated methylase
MTIITNDGIQAETWSGEFGDDYVERNISIDVVDKDYFQLTGLKYNDIFSDFFQELDRDLSILEVGCNVGNNLSILRSLGFTNLQGLDVNSKAIGIASSRYPDISFHNSSIQSCKLPSKNFDLVYTAGVLVHIHPDTLTDVIKKILSLSKQYVFGFESFSESPSDVFYRNSNNLYWKQNFPELFKNISPNITQIKEKKIPYQNSNLSDICYLFKQ